MGSMPPSERADGSDRLPNTLPTTKNNSAISLRPEPQRGSQRRDGAAEVLLERRHRHDRQRGDRDHDQPAEQAARLPARQEAPPRCRVAEFGFQKGDAEAEA